MTSYLEHVRAITTAYSNPVQASIIHLLSIYGKLSTTELADKLDKAKSTVLRRLELLVKTDLILEDKITEGRGRYPTRYFSLNKNHNLSVEGRMVRNTETEFTSEDYEAYLRTFQSRYVLSREIMDQAVLYLEKMIHESKKYSSRNEILEFGKDNLGSIEFEYLTKSKLWESEFGTESKENEGENKEYLHLSLILPVRRLIDIVHSDQWTKEGDIWPYE